MEPRWLLSAWLSSCRTSASACARCALLSTCRLTSSSLRCPSSAATNRPSTVASSSATSVIWRAAAEFMVDDRGTSLKLNANRCRDTKSRASFHPEYIIPRSLPRAPRHGVSSFRALACAALSDGREGSQRRLRLTRQCRSLPTADHARNDPPPRALPRPDAAPVPHPLRPPSWWSRSCFRPWSAGEPARGLRRRLHSESDPRRPQSVCAPPDSPPGAPGGARHAQRRGWPEGDGPRGLDHSL